MSVRKTDLIGTTPSATEAVKPSVKQEPPKGCQLFLVEGWEASFVVHVDQCPLYIADGKLEWVVILVGDLEDFTNYSLRNDYFSPLDR